MTQECRTGGHPLDRRTQLAGGELCFDCATATRWRVQDGAITNEETGVRLAWGGYARKRGCSMTIEPEDKARNLSLMAAAPELLRVVQLVATGYHTDLELAIQLARPLIADRLWPL